MDCRARFLGHAITPGAVYISMNDGKKTSVVCCKGDIPLPSSTKDKVSKPSSSKHLLKPDISHLSKKSSHESRSRDKSPQPKTLQVPLQTYVNIK